MPTTARRTRLPQVTPEQVWAWHAAPGTLERLLPPWRPLQVEARPATLQPGQALALRVGLGPLSWRWRSVLTAVDAPHGFEDRADAPPFRAWHHRHGFEPEPDGTALTDVLTWTLPPHLALGRPLAARELARLLAWRHRVTGEDLARHARWREQPRLTVGVTGASGLVGTALTHFLTAGGHRVVPFVRRAPREGEIGWSVAGRRLDPRDLEGLDAVVHLAGEPIAPRPWTAERRRRIRDSRIVGTRLLAEALARCARRPRVLVSISGVGYWGDARAPVDEGSPPGEGFLPSVAISWEAAADPAREAGVRVVHPRLASVLSGRGGMLPTIALPFRLGLGGPMGSGRQAMPWIALEDVVGIVHEALHDPRYEGPIAAVAPHTPSHADFTRTLARVLGRPAVLRAPAPLVRLLLGDLGQELLLEGQLVRPRRLQELGYTWSRPDLEDTLRWELGRFPIPEA